VRRLYLSETRLSRKHDSPRRLFRKG